MEEYIKYTDDAITISQEAIKDLCERRYEELDKFIRTSFASNPSRIIVFLKEVRKYGSSMQPMSLLSHIYIILTTLTINKELNEKQQHIYCALSLMLCGVEYTLQLIKTKQSKYIDSIDKLLNVIDSIVKYELFGYDEKWRIKSYGEIIEYLYTNNNTEMITQIIQKLDNDVALSIIEKVMTDSMLIGSNENITFLVDLISSLNN